MLFACAGFNGYLMIATTDLTEWLKQTPRDADLPQNTVSAQLEIMS